MNREFEQIYYHANCVDGVTGAAILAGDIGTFASVAIPCTYGKTVPEGYEDKRVAVVDFSCDADTMRDMAEKAAHLTVLDHHKSAEPVLRMLHREYPHRHVVYGENAKCESGAMLAYQYTYGRAATVPYLVEAIARRDTWNFVGHVDEQDVRQIAAGLAHLRETSGDAELANRICEYVAYPVRRFAIDSHVMAIGATVLEVAHGQIQRELEGSSVSTWMDRKCVILNAKHHVSDLGAAALEKHPDADYAVMWYENTAGHTCYSFRSRPGSNADCSLLAGELGGGGHKNAAGAAVNVRTFRIAGEK